MTPMEAEARRKYDRSHITDEERRAIDAAVQAGRIQRIPRGVSANPDALVWDHNLNALRLVAPNEHNRFNGKSRAAKKPNMIGVTAATERRMEARKKAIAQAAKLHGQGKTVAEIMAAMAIHEQTVREYLKVAGVKLQSAQIIKRNRAAAEAREIHATGKTITEISEIMGIGRKAIRSYLKGDLT